MDCLNTRILTKIILGVSVGILLPMCLKYVSTLLPCRQCECLYLTTFLGRPLFAWKSVASHPRARDYFFIHNCMDDLSHAKRSTLDCRIRFSTYII